jgi:hypothetical protein
MDDKREGRPSFKTSDVKNEVRDVIDGDRRLTVREVANKCIISKTTVHEILVQELHMNRICAFKFHKFLVSSYPVIKNLHKLISFHVKYYIYYGLS